VRPIEICVLWAIEHDGMFCRHGEWNLMVLPGREEFKTFVYECMPDPRSRLSNTKLDKLGFRNYRVSTLESFVVYIGYWKASDQEEPMGIKPHKRRFS
jgi:hypothetical protein